MTIMMALFSVSGAQSELRKVASITGSISTKSIVHNGNGLFFAQNMMYRHTITVYNRQFKLVKTIEDTASANLLGVHRRGSFQGSPVECAFSPDGRTAWVSNYQMYGAGFNKPGHDRCGGEPCDFSYLYEVDVDKLTVIKAIRVGSVPKYVAATPHGDRVLVSNWCSYDLSVVDAKLGREIRRVKLGRFPRGIVVNPIGSIAYVAIMGSNDVAKVDLSAYTVKWIRGVGASPRHLCISPNGQTLYATLNGEGQVAKVDLRSAKTVGKVSTGRAPRSMVLSKDGRWLYVVNYESNTMSKVRASDLKVMETVKTGVHPIGITFDDATRQVWVACYRGVIQVFQD